jgi:lipoprotein-releasing system permease protein
VIDPLVIPLSSFPVLAPLFLAFRYLRPTRSFISVITVISMLGVMLGVGVLVTVMSVFKGWQIEFRKMLLGFEPHVVVMSLSEGNHASPDSAASPNWRELREKLSKDKKFLSATPVAEGHVVVEKNGSLQGIPVLGLSPEGDNALARKLSKHMKEGIFNLKDDHIILTDHQAREIGAKLGDTIVVHASASVRQFIAEVREIPEDGAGELRAEKLDNVSILSKDLKIVGILRGDTAGTRGYVPLNIAQEFFDLDGAVTAIELEVSDPDQAADLMETVYKDGTLPSNWGWRTWDQEHADILQSVENQRVMMYFLLLFIMIVAAICVMNTTITVTVKKRREIGILTALGTRAWQIIAIFVTQAGFVAVLGVIGGILGGFAVLSVRNTFRQWVASTFQLDLFPQDIYFLSEIPAYTDWADLSLICSTAVCLCLLAAIIPSFFAARVDPAVALRD